jgi:hypothetical protein
MCRLEIQIDGSACSLHIRISCLSYSSTLKMEAILSSETFGITTKKSVLSIYFEFSIIRQLLTESLLSDDPLSSDLATLIF